MITLSTISSTKLIRFDNCPTQALGCDWWEVIIALANDLAPNMCQAIIWAYDDPTQQPI